MFLQILILCCTHIWIKKYKIEHIYKIVGPQREPTIYNNSFQVVCDCVVCVPHCYFHTKSTAEQVQTSTTA